MPSSRLGCRTALHQSSGMPPRGLLLGVREADRRQSESGLRIAHLTSAGHDPDTESFTFIILISLGGLFNFLCRKQWYKMWMLPDKLTRT
jgi:hypothetical protein